jgi:tetratricopeptide (TPR) repeat protein
VRREGQNVRVSARLVGTADSSQIWSHTYSGETASIFRVQQEIARGIAEALQGRLSQANLTRLQTIGTRDEEAHDLHLSGVWLLERARSPEQQRQAVNYLERASVKDPKYAAPLAVLSRYHAMNSGFDPAELSKALALAAKAVSLADDSAEAHLALADVLQYNWEWTRAEQEFRRAMSLQPSYWQARADFADYLTLHGRFAEARQLIDEVNGLSPLDMEAQCMKGKSIILSGAGMPHYPIIAADTKSILTTTSFLSSWRQHCFVPDRSLSRLLYIRIRSRFLAKTLSIDLQFEVSAICVGRFTTWKMPETC